MDCKDDNLLLSESDWAEQGSEGAHREAELDRLHPLNTDFAHHVSGHTEYGVVQVMRVTISLHHVRQLRVIHEMNR